MRKVLSVGIDTYEILKPNLSTCKNDAEEISRIFSSGKLKYQVTKLIDSDATTANIRKEVHELFTSKSEIAIFYFSGHGFDDNNDGVLVAYDGEKNNFGVDMSYIIKEANLSNCRNRIVILDCCHAGFIGEIGAIGDITFIKDGVVLLTSCREKETSRCGKKFSAFSSYLIEGLNGGASNIFGEITPENIYGYIDNLLDAKQQRPLFKANVSNFVILAKTCPKISRKKIKEILNYFPTINSTFQLSPDFEPTNLPGSKYYHKKPYFNENKGKQFAFLQKLNRLGIVKPDQSKHMYFAAMKSKTCSLTNYGKFLWNMVKKG